MATAMNYTNETLRVADLVTDPDMPRIESCTFENCELVGPAIPSG